MKDQVKAIKAYYNASNTIITSPNPAPNTHPEWADWKGPDGIEGNQDDTLAPGGLWSNYISSKYTSLTQETEFPVLKINNVIHYPYRPGFTTYVGWYVDNVNYNFKHIFPSAGVDCVGFVQRCASYKGNKYALRNYTVADTWEVGGTWIQKSANLRDDNGINNIENDTKTWKISDPNLLVPGDLLYLPGPSGTGDMHVGFVLRVKYSHENKRVINKNSNGSSKDIIIIIESTKAGILELWRVIKQNSWQSLGAGYSPKRLVVTN